LNALLGCAIRQHSSNGAGLDYTRPIHGSEKFPLAPARVVLIDRYNVLTEDTVEAFAEANKFRRLPDENVATNPAVRFRVETFEPSEGFQPRKPYQSRLKWRDQDGNEQSKLLLTKPETVIAVVLRGEAAPAPHPQQSPSEAPAPQRRTRKPARLAPSQVKNPSATYQKSRPPWAGAVALAGAGLPRREDSAMTPGSSINSRVIRASAFGAGLI
jgi:hypothetical protein